MAENSKIEWTDSTWNIITGCSVVSAGCKHCYAMKLAGTRLQHHHSRAGLTIGTSAGPVWNGLVRFNEDWLMQPLQWKLPRRIFVCAHGDLFHESVPDEWIDKVFAVMAMAPQHTFQVLTKRPTRMKAYFNMVDEERDMQRWIGAAVEITNSPCAAHIIEDREYPLPNVWLGVSVENQKAADERIPLLLETPAAVHWISAEPLLGPVSIFSEITGELLLTSGDEYNPGAIDWIVVGGESGPEARPMHPAWARSLRDQCASAGVPFLFKQWGEWSPDDAGETPHSDVVGILPSGDCAFYSQGYVAPWDSQERLVAAGLIRLDGRTLMDRVGKKRAGRLLDGIQHDGYPEVQS